MQKYLYQKNNLNRLTIRLANQNDKSFVYDLFNENVVKKKFFSKKKVTFAAHKVWFLNKLKEKMFYICSHKYRIGYIRFDHLNKDSLSVSIAIKDRFKKKGYGTIMLKKTLMKKKIIKKSIYAFVKNNNISSKMRYANAVKNIRAAASFSCKNQNN